MTEATAVEEPEDGPPGPQDITCSGGIRLPRHLNAQPQEEDGLGE